MNRYLNRARPFAAFLAIVLCSAAAAPPAAAAAEPAPARPLAVAAEAAGAALPPSAVTQATPTTSPAPAAVPEGKPFFKSTKGVLAVVLTGAALGYMGYAFSHDRVKSPAR